MIKAIIASLAMAFAVNASANPVVDTLVAQQQNNIRVMVSTMALNWKVGESANYNVDMGFIKGTMVMSVASIGADGIWMNQDMDLGFMGKQQVQTLLDPNTGAILKMIVNGQEQQPPTQDIEIISTLEESVTVPAGTFDSLHVVAKDKSNNDEINFWINPKVVPLSGMLKQVAPSQFGQVTVELTSFNKL